MIANIERSVDDAVLAMLRMRARGVTCKLIAEFMRWHSDAAVRVATNRVLAADLAESGETPAQVTAGYGRMTHPPIKTSARQMQTMGYSKWRGGIE